ncbi:MAG: rRNA maturation RNase YbeY [Acidobacteria bacterium]|nr:MAG: rRNA maturation RNase YbeY [Acidobacteriota bacterium]
MDARTQMPLVVNLQRKIKLDTSVVKKFVSTLPTKIDEADGRDFAIAFVSDRRMKELNGFFRGKDSTTDVLSFPHEPDEFDNENTNLGDIVISVEQAERQAKENKLTLENEIKQLILHGLLHLCGFDHETDDGEMNKRELALRKKLGI